jgi:predicted hydrocarbon binding protein
MKAITKSGYYYPNRLAYATFTALIDLMGKNGLNAILNLTQQNGFIDNFPADNMEKGFDFADFSALQMGLEEMYGDQGGRMFLKRAGRFAFDQSLKKYGALAGISDPAFRSLPLQTQVRIGLQALARIFTQISDQQTTVEEDVTLYKYIVLKCPQCWDRKGINNSICSYGTGLLEEGMKWITGGFEFKVSETKCMAKGDDVCEYSIDKNPING